MEITKECYTFWTILEQDLNTKIKNYIKNVLSFCGYGNALVFKDIEDNDIKSVQNYVRTDLPLIFESAISLNQMQHDAYEKAYFFGPYAAAPQNFQFAPGDVKTLFAMIRYVKSIVDQPTENQGLHHFVNNSIVSKRNLSYERNLVPSVFGLVFGCLLKKRQTEMEEKLTNSRKELFSKAQSVLLKNEECGVKPMRKFTIEMVEVKLEDQKFKGRVKCSFCHERELSGDVSVFCKASGCWVITNLSTHLQRKHTAITPINHPDVNGQISKNSEVFQKDDSVLVERDSAQFDVSVQSAEDSQEDVLYIQISTQNIKMTNAVMRNKDKVLTKNFGLQPAAKRAERAIKFCRVSGNGNCFFYSVAHQLYNVKIGTQEYEQKALEIRKNIVEFIKRPENLPNFLYDLKNRITISNNTDEHEKVQACINYLNAHLSNSGTWAGTESIRAVSMMNNVNILVMNDDGSYSLPTHFNPLANRSIHLLFSAMSGKAAKSNEERVHYDSIVGISAEKIALIAKEISGREAHHINFLNKEHSLVEID